MKYGYIRAAFIEASGNISDQLETLKSAGADKIFPDILLIENSPRTQFELLLSQICRGDTLIILRLMDIGTTLSRACEQIARLVEQEIIVEVLELDFTFTSTAGRSFVYLQKIANIDNRMRREACAEGRVIARQRDGYSEGRPRLYGDDDIQRALTLQAEYGYKRASEMTGISQRSIRRWRKALEQ